MRTGRLQVVDIPEVKTEVTEFRVVSRRCGCGRVTAGVVPAGVVGGPVCHGPNVTAAAAFPHAHGQLGTERTAEVVNGLFGTQVSAGWIGKVAVRLAGCLFGFEADVKTALPAAPMTLADETSVNTIADDAEAEATGGAAPRGFNPHVFTMRTADLVWLGAGRTRGHGALDFFGLFDRYTGIPVSDDHNGYSKYETLLTARQLCNAHLIRSLRGVVDAEPGAHDWAKVMIRILREGRAAVKAAIADGHTALTGEQIGLPGVQAPLLPRPVRPRPRAGSCTDRGQGQRDPADDPQRLPQQASPRRPDPLGPAGPAAIRRKYLMWVESGIVENTGRHTSRGKRHEAWVLAARLKKKID